MSNFTEPQEDQENETEETTFLDAAVGYLDRAQMTSGENFEHAIKLAQTHALVGILGELSWISGALRDIAYELNTDEDDSFARRLLLGPERAVEASAWRSGMDDAQTGE